MKLKGEVKEICIRISKTHAETPKSEVFLRKDILRKCNKFTGQLQVICNFIEITFPHGCSPVGLLFIFRILVL